MSKLRLRSEGQSRSSRQFFAHVEGFKTFGRRGLRRETAGVPTFINEYWTAKQRQGHSLHEISYRACFKPQLPAFFLETLSQRGDAVYDPFLGRGTTPLEAALRGRRPLGNDINPLSGHLFRPRLRPPTQEQVQARLDSIDLSSGEAGPFAPDLEAFYHPDTLGEIVALRAYFLNRAAIGQLDSIDDWIRMVAINRLTGHSPGFFSVYTLPPNQAVTANAQRAINQRREQIPPRRPIKERILRKSLSLLRKVDEKTRRTLAEVQPASDILTQPAHDTPQLAAESVSLVVTSPPFLDVVDYATDNWLRCWFCGIDPQSVQLTVPRNLKSWCQSMSAVFKELHRVLRPGGHVAFEVGEVRGGRIKLEESVIPCAREAGFAPLLVMINDQKFTKTANCWGVSNRVKGTNTNRICVFSK